MQVIKPPTPLAGDHFKRFSVFLGGSIEMGAAVEWQAQVQVELADLDVTIFNPRRDSWDSSWEQDASNPEFAGQVNWEMSALELCDLVLIYFDPKTKAPISLFELGMVARQQIFDSKFAGQEVIVACPPGFYRRGNVQLICDKFQRPMVNSLAELIATARLKIIYRP